MIRPSQRTMPLESPNTVCASRRGSSWAPVSTRRVLLKAAGTRKAPAVSPISRTGRRAFGSRVKEKPEAREARGRSHAPMRGVRLTNVLSVRCVSTPRSCPKSEARPWRSSRPIVVESP